MFPRINRPCTTLQDALHQARSWVAPGAIMGCCGSLRCMLGESDYVPDGSRLVTAALVFVLSRIEAGGEPAGTCERNPPSKTKLPAKRATLTSGAACNPPSAFSIRWLAIQQTRSQFDRVQIIACVFLPRQTRGIRDHADALDHRDTFSRNAAAHRGLWFTFFSSMPAFHCRLPDESFTVEFTSLPYRRNTLIGVVVNSRSRRYCHGTASAMISARERRSRGSRKITPESACS
jgi:hypothetical protein